MPDRRENILDGDMRILALDFFRGVAGLMELPDRVGSDAGSLDDPAVVRDVPVAVDHSDVSRITLPRGAKLGNAANCQRHATLPRSAPRA